jgi:hypothetical protein
MPAGDRRLKQPTLETILEATQAFLRASHRPVLVEPGEEPLPLGPDNHRLELRDGRLVFEAWEQHRLIVRRLVGLRTGARGRLELIVERFGKRQGNLLLYDEQRAGSSELRRGRRLVFRERFRLSLRRSFPGWRLADLSADADLENSLSGAFPRAFLVRGAAGWAAIAAPPEARDAAGVLTFGLIWLDYLRRRERRIIVEGLALFVPEHATATTCLRLRHLDPRLARFAVFVLGPEGFEEQIDPSDFGNLNTQLEPCPRTPPALPPLARRLASLAPVESVPAADGTLSFRVRGLEFARLAGETLLFGLSRPRAATAADWETIEELVAELDQLRSPEARDSSHPLFRERPEAWLESQVRRSLRTIDAALEPEPIYSHVPAIAGADRGIIDLVTADRQGRLAVIELKASADPHLPLQALDYWMRVRWHSARDEFRTRGYFPGRSLSPATPRLLLVAPALEFHPTTEILLGALSPEIPVERIGLAADWRRQLRVVFRVAGAARPGLAGR